VADIEVERKGPSIWPWVIGLLVLALLIWALVELFEDDEMATQPVLEQPSSIEVRPQVGPAAPDTPHTDVALPPDTADTQIPAGATRPDTGAALPSS
jgi:hypothetical protein